MTQYVIQTCKIKDGLYIGDENSVKDFEFLELNKVGYIINTVINYVPNHCELAGFKVRYLGLQIDEIPALTNDMLDQIYAFIEESALHGQSCLIHSVHGQSRSCSVLAYYLMRKYKWTLFKTLEFLNSRRGDLEIKQSFFQFLGKVEHNLSLQYRLSVGWEAKNLLDEETIIQNTYLNAQVGQIDTAYSDYDEYEKLMSASHRFKLHWCPILTSTEPSRSHPLRSIQSIIKGSKKQPIQTVQPRPIRNYSVNQEVIVKEPTPLLMTFAVPQKQNQPQYTELFPPAQKFIQLPIEKEKENIPPPTRKAARSQSFNTSEYEKQAEMIKNYLQSEQMKKFSKQLQEPPIEEKQRQVRREKLPRPQSFTPGMHKPPMVTYKPKTQSQQVQVSKSQNQVASPVIILKPKMPDFEEKKQPYNVKNIDIQKLVDQYHQRSNR